MTTKTRPEAGSTTPDTSRQENSRPRHNVGNERVEQVWKRLEMDLGHEKIERYFSGQTLLSLKDNRLEVTVASGLSARMLSTQFGESLRRAAAVADADAEIQVAFQVDRAAFDAKPAPAPLKAQPRHRVPPKPLARYRFDNFVVGAANKLAHAAALRTAEEEGPAAPLFIHGSCGLGKTHLLHAIVARFAERRPGANVKYTTAEAFTNEFIAAVRTGKIEGFRKTYRKVDLLCIDDVHFLSSKEQTQIELLYTLDCIGLDGARLVLASDEHPRDIRKVSDKLISRFMAGAVVKVETPDEELRARLLRHLAQARSLRLDEPALKLLCDRSARSVGSLGGFGGSVRELEGLLIQVEAVHRLFPESSGGDAIGVGLVRRALGLSTDENRDSAPAPALRPRRPIAASTIVAEVCRSLSVDISDFMGKGRHPRVVLARSVTSFICRKLTTLSFPEIARAMGRGNHSTVITAHRRVERDLPKKDTLPADLAPGHAGCTLMELIDALSRQIVRNASGL